jgi:hypothetical protein
LTPTQGTASVRQILCNDAILYRVISGDESWIYSYDRQNNNPPSGKVQTHRPKKFKQVKSKVKIMLIVFYDIKGIVQKEFTLSLEPVNSIIYHINIQK